MLYLYTLFMFAWDLDEDTHAYFRKYLEVFINKRKISKDLREFVVENCPPRNCWDAPLLSEIYAQNLLRKGLRRMYRHREGDLVRTPGSQITPIDKLHPSKLYLFGMKGKHFTSNADRPGQALLLEAKRIREDPKYMSRPSNIAPNYITLEFLHPWPMLGNAKAFFERFREKGLKDITWYPELDNREYFPETPPSKHYPRGVKKIPYCLMRMEDL
jgi:hypothetical protein